MTGTPWLLPEPWTPLDLAADPQPPTWLVPDFLAEGWITLNHGREGAGKSLVYQTIIGAALTGQDWLGRPVNIDRIVVVDEENPLDVVNQRLKAVGYVHERDAERLAYFSQLGCRLGDGRWSEQLLSLVKQNRPQLVVIDSMSSATVATWGNETITPLFQSVFKPLAKLGCAVLLNHHDRKAGGEVQDRASGGTQWLAQVDRQIAFEKRGQIDVSELDDGAVRLAFPITIEAGKARQGKPFPETHLLIISESEPDDHDRLRRMWLELDESPATVTTPRDGEAWRPTWYMERATKAITENPGITLNQLAEIVGRKREYLRRAVDVLIQEGTVRVEDGPRNAQRHYPADATDHQSPLS